MALSWFNVKWNFGFLAFESLTATCHMATAARAPPGKPAVAPAEAIDAGRGHLWKALHRGTGTGTATAVSCGA
jgi:hypothetical protein